MRRRADSKSHLRWIASVAAAALVASGCGSRLDRAEVVAVHEAGRAAGSSSPDEAGAAGVAPLSDAGTGTPVEGSTDAVVAGAASPAAGSGVAPRAGATAGRPSGTAAAKAAGPAGGGGAAQPSGKAATPSSAGAPRQAAGAPVTLGHIGTYSGIAGAQLASALPTIQAWAKSVNARGGLNGHPVRLITADDGADPARNLALTKDMVENQGVVAFVGNQVPFSVTGSEKYLRDKQVPAVGGDVVHPLWHQSPILFPQGQFIDTLLVEAARVGVREGKKRFGLLYCAEAPPCQHANDVYRAGAAEKAGAQLVYSAQVSITQPDFTAECLQAQRNNVEIVFLAADAATNTRISRSCAQQNVKPLYVTQTIATSNALEKEPGLEGLTVVSPVFPWVAADTPAAQEFHQALRTYAPGTQAAGPGAMVWTSGKLMERISGKLGAAATPAQVLEGLYELRDETLGGLMTPVTYRRGAVPLIQNSCSFVVKVVKGKWSAPQGSRQAC